MTFGMDTKTVNKFIMGIFHNLRNMLKSFKNTT